MVALVGSWPHIGPCRNRSGRTAHYRTFRTITAGRDDLEVMVKPSGGGGLLPGGVTTIFVLHQQPTIVLHGPSITYEGEGIEGRGAECCIAYAKVNSSCWAFTRTAARSSATSYCLSTVSMKVSSSPGRGQATRTTTAMASRRAARWYGRRWVTSATGRRGICSC